MALISSACSDSDSFTFTLLYTCQLIIIIISVTSPFSHFTLHHILVPPIIQYILTSQTFRISSGHQFLANVNSSSGSLYVVVRPFVVCRLSSVCLSSVTFVRPTQPIEIFGNVFTPFGTLAIRDLCVKILRRSSQGNPSGGGLNRRGVAKYSDFGPFQGYISETMQDRR